MDVTKAGVRTHVDKVEVIRQGWRVKRDAHLITVLQNLAVTYQPPVRSEDNE